MASNLISQVLLINQVLLLYPMAATRATEDTAVVTNKLLAFVLSMRKACIFEPTH